MWSRKNVVPVVALVLAAGTTAACGSSAANESSPLTGVEQRSPAPKQITLREVYGGGWDRAVVVCPYAQRAEVERAVGRDWDGADEVDELGDDQQAVVLLKGRSVTRTDRTERSSVDLCGTTRPATASVAPGARLQLSPDRLSDGSSYLRATF